VEGRPPLDEKEEYTRQERKELRQRRWLFSRLPFTNVNINWQKLNDSWTKLDEHYKTWLPNANLRFALRCLLITLSILTTTVLFLSLVLYLNCNTAPSGQEPIPKTRPLCRDAYYFMQTGRLRHSWDPNATLKESAKIVSDKAGETYEQFRDVYGPQLREKANEAADKMREYQEQYGPIVKEKADEAYQKMQEYQKTYGPIMKKNAREAYDKLVEYQQTYASGPVLREKAEEAGQKFKEYQATYGPILKEKANDAYLKLQEYQATYFPIIKEKAGEAAETLKEKGEEAAGYVYHKGGEAAEYAALSFRQSLTIIWRWFRGLQLRMLKNTLLGTFTVVKSLLFDLPLFILWNLGSVAQLVTRLVIDLIVVTWEYVRLVLQSAWYVVRGFFVWVKSSTYDTANNVPQYWGEIKHGLKH